MWTAEARELYEDDGQRQSSDLMDAKWQTIEPVLRSYATLTVDLREMINAYIYLEKVRLRIYLEKVRLRLVNAAYAGAHSDAEIARARSLAEPLGDHVQFHTGFLPHGRSLELLGGCDLIVLPNRPSQEASSAALRTVLTTSVPVAVSRIALFDEAEDAVLRLDAATAESLADGIDALLADTALRRRLQQRAAGWMRDRAWPPIARRLTDLLIGLARSRLGTHPH